jgi:PAS domain S-box-containing protein
MPTPIHILIIEDRPADAELMLHALRREGFEPDSQRVDTETEFLASLETSPDLILADWSLPQFSGLRALKLMNERGLDVPFIIVSGSIGEETAVEAMRQGAADYLLKDRLPRLGQAVRRALEDKQLRQEQKQAVELLLQEEERYRSIFEGVKDAIFVEALSGEILNVNRQACEMFGYTREQFLTKTVADLVPSEKYIIPFDLKAAPEIYDQPIETVNVRANGEQFPIEISMRLQNQNGEDVLLVVGRDITERKRAEEALKFKMEQLVALSRASRAVTASLDLDQLLEEVMSLAGEVVASDYASVVLVDETGRITRSVENKQGVLSVAQNARTRGFTRWIIRTRRPAVVDEIGEDGNVRPRIGEGAPRKAHPAFVTMGIKSFIGLPLIVEERTVGVLYLYSLLPGAFHDQVPLLTTFAGQAAIAIEKARLYDEVQKELAEREQAEKELRQSEENYRNLIDGMNETVWVIGFDGNLVDVNKKALDVFGYSKEELLSVGLFGIDSSLKKEDIVALAKAMPVDETQIFETTHTTKTGRTFPVEVYSSLIMYKGERAILSIARDITERKQAEKDLVESEGRFRQLFENMSSGVVVYEAINNGEDFKIKDFNQAAEKSENISKETVIGKTVCEAFPGVKEFGLLEVFQHVWRTGKPERYPISFYKDNRVSGWRENYVAKLPSGEVVAIYDDVTERRQAEEALAEERARVRLLMDTTPDHIYFKDVKSRFTQINQAQAHRFGLGDPAQAIGKTDFDFFTEEHARQAYEDEQNIIRSGQPVVNKEEKETWPDGGVGWVSTTKMPMRDQEGKIVGTFGISRDITERKLAEEALAQERNLLRSLIDNAPDYIYVKDTHGRFMIANPAVARLMTGVSTPDEVLGKTDFDFFPQELAGKYYADEQALFQSGQALLESEEPTFDSAGNPRWISTTKVPLRDAQGHIFGLVGLGQEITERKQAEERLAQQAEELRQRNEELARLYRASGSLISGVPLKAQELAEKIVAAVLQEFGQTNCSLLVIDKESNELVRLAAAGPYADQVKFQNLSLDGLGLVPRAIRTGEVVNVGDVDSAPDYVQGWELAKSELTIPLRIGNDIIGVIDLQSAEPDAFSQNDERMMTIFAERAALAIEHGRLNLQTEARMQQLIALRTVDMAISGSFDINLTLGVLLDQLIGRLSIHAADVLAFNPITQTFTLAGQRGFLTPPRQLVQLSYGTGFAWRAVTERHVVTIPDLRDMPDGWQRSPGFSGEQFLAYIGVPLIAKGQIKGVLEVFHRESLHLDKEQYSFLEMLAGQAAIAIDNSELFERLQSSNAELSMAYDNTLEGWARALELRDKDTEGHTRRVTDMTLRLARELGVNESDMVNMYRGALLHDIGKMGVPDNIVLKPGPLTDEEWVIMRKHPQYAYDMLSPISYLRQALEIPYCHHEKWDGTGYPRGLKGEQIPQAARIFAVVDVWDALTSDRPYRKAWPEEKARQYIQEQAGKHFDPEVTRAFLKGNG